MGSQFIFILILGLAPQALCFRLLRRLRTALFVQGQFREECIRSTESEYFSHQTTLPPNSKQSNWKLLVKTSVKFIFPVHDKV